MFNYKNYLFSVLVLSFGVLNTNVIAQDESADDVEEVIVTGTRLKVDGFEAVSPVTVVTADNIKRTGQTRIEDVLNQMPQIETANSSFEPSGETGTASLDLRGLGGSRTLTLLNGKRMQPGSIWSEDSDVGQIPVQLLERVDVLTGGASAVYGSDAIGGVVNLITKKDYDGITISATTSSPDLPGGEEESFSIVGGFSNEDSRVLWTYEHQQRDIIYMTDRESVSYTHLTLPTIYSV